MSNEDKQIVVLLKSYIDSYNLNKSSNSRVLLSEPVFKKRDNSIEINLFFFEGKKDEFAANFVSSKISTIIGKYYDRHVSVQFTKIYYPYINASIFAQFLFYNSSANTFMHFQNAVLKSFSWHGKELIAHMKGIKVEVSGRIMTEKVIPRVTKKSMVFGSLSNCEYIDYSKYTRKNFIGTITVKV